MWQELLHKLEKVSYKFLVVGDVMLDRYCYGNINRISPEAPVPVLLFKGEHFLLGGAANVALNLKYMGQNVSLISVIGDDPAGHNLLSLLEKEHIESRFLLKSHRNITTEKIRIVAESQQVLRIDHEEKNDLNAEIKDYLLTSIRERINECDIILLSDYMKGVLSDEVTSKIIELANEEGKKVLVDVKGSNPRKYCNAYLLKPNKKELKELTGRTTDTEVDIIEAMYELKRMANCQCVVTTLGADGMILLNEGGQTFRSKVKEKSVYDVVGAGDTAFAYLGLGIVHRLDETAALTMANQAATIKVGKFGTAIVSLQEVAEELGGYNKLCSIDEIAEILKYNRNKKVVFTNGCFDVLHIGHVKFLKAAKKLGDILVVGLNSDSSIKRIKGEDRPVNEERDRIEMLLELDFIDYVVVFQENTPETLIRAVRPDILVKGGDYKTDNIVGKDIVQSYGGDVMTLPYVKGKSSSNIIKKMKLLQGVT